MSRIILVFVCCIFGLAALMIVAGAYQSSNPFGSNRVDIHVDKEHETVCYTYRESITCMPMFNDDEPN